MSGRLQEVRKAVDMRPLKALAAERLPRDSLLSRVLAAEPDLIPAAEYIGKLGTWLSILREESKD